MTPAERITEINRLLAIFNKGCSITAVPPAPATDCEECTADILRRIQNVAAGRPHDEGADEPSAALVALMAGDMETHDRIMREAGLEGVDPMAFTPGMGMLAKSERRVSIRQMAEDVMKRYPKLMAYLAKH